MANLHGTGFDDVISQMRRLGEDAGDTCQRMLDAGAEAVREAWTATADAHGFVDTGDMIASITVAQSKRDPGAPVREIFPQGKDRKGVRNAEKAYILHYGTSKIAASYWVDEAEAAAEEPMATAMAAVWDDFIRGRE